MAPGGGGERSLIDALLQRFPQGPETLAGPGDDAAVVAARPICATSVDAAIEGVHFELGPGRYRYGDVGFKALASALSDLAAMGVEPGEAYLTLCVPPGLSEWDALALADGAAEVALASGATIAGGDIVAAPQLGVCATVVGWTDAATPPVYRSGARPGDLVGVTGRLGGAGAGLEQMHGRISLDAASAAEALARARRPLPRVREGRCLAASGAQALIDLSDGLATDAAHVGRASGAVLQIDLELLPLGRGVVEAAAQLGSAPWELAACAGEDYELCACVAPGDRERVDRALAAVGGERITWVGRVLERGERDAGARFLLDGAEVELHGFEHRW